MAHAEHEQTEAPNRTRGNSRCRGSCGVVSTVALIDDSLGNSVETLSRRFWTVERTFEHGRAKRCMQPPDHTELSFQVLVEHDRLLEQLVEDSSVVTDKGELLRLMISDYTNTKGPEFWLSEPPLSEEKRALKPLENQRELIKRNGDTLAENDKVSVETIEERFEELYEQQIEIIEILRSRERNRF